MTVPPPPRLERFRADLEALTGAAPARSASPSRAGRTASLCCCSRRPLSRARSRPRRSIIACARKAPTRRAFVARNLRRARPAPRRFSPPTRRSTAISRPAPARFATACSRAGRPKQGSAGCSPPTMPTIRPRRWPCASAAAPASPASPASAPLTEIAGLSGRPAAARLAARGAGRDRGRGRHRAGLWTRATRTTASTAPASASGSPRRTGSIRSPPPAAPPRSPRPRTRSTGRPGGCSKSGSRRSPGGLPSIRPACRPSSAAACCSACLRSAGEPPRGEAVQRLLATLEAGGTATLAGVKCEGGAVWRFSPAPPRPLLAPLRPHQRLVQRRQEARPVGLGERRRPAA